MNLQVEQSQRVTMERLPFFTKQFVRNLTLQIGIRIIQRL